LGNGIIHVAGSRYEKLDERGGRIRISSYAKLIIYFPDICKVGNAHPTRDPSCLLGKE
jgi:hypothetical protein